MFLPFIGAALVGALAMGRTKPKTRAEKKTVLGARSGLNYEVEDFTEAGFIVVRARDGSCATLLRAAVRHPGKPGFIWQQGKGNHQTLQAIHSDFCPKPPPQPDKSKEEKP